MKTSNFCDNFALYTPIPVSIVSLNEFSLFIDLLKSFYSLIFLLETQKLDSFKFPKVVPFHV